MAKPKFPVKPTAANPAKATKKVAKTPKGFVPFTKKSGAGGKGKGK